jgi:hypothetical protein
MSTPASRENSQVPDGAGCLLSPDKTTLRDEPASTSAGRGRPPKSSRLHRRYPASTASAWPAITERTSPMIGSLITTFVVGGITAALIGLYLLPALLACARHVPDIGLIAVINILFGWTVAGWVIALALALRSGAQPNPTVQLVQYLPPPPPPPAANWAGGPAQPGRWPAATPPLPLPPLPEGSGYSTEGDDQQW